MLVEHIVEKDWLQAEEHQGAELDEMHGTSTPHDAEQSENHCEGEICRPADDDVGDGSQTVIHEESFECGSKEQKENTQIMRSFSQDSGSPLLKVGFADISRESWGSTKDAPVRETHFSIPPPFLAKADSQPEGIDSQPSSVDTLDFSQDTQKCRFLKAECVGTKQDKLSMDIQIYESMSDVVSSQEEDAIVPDIRPLRKQEPASDTRKLGTEGHRSSVLRL